MNNDCKKNFDFLKRTFPLVGNELYHCIENQSSEDFPYKEHLISLFDHILSEEEAERLCVFYDEESSNSFMKKYLKGEEKFLSFYKQLNSNYQIIVDSPTFGLVEVESTDKFIEICRNSLREIELIDLYIPTLKCIFVGAQDLNIMLYSLETPNLKNIIKNSGLNLVK